MQFVKILVTVAIATAVSFDSADATTNIGVNENAPAARQLRTPTPSPKKQRQQAGDHNNSVARLSFVFELETSSVCDYLFTADIAALFEASLSAFSQEFVEILTLEGVNRFAKENKTHVGRRCACDWMRHLYGTNSHTNCGGEEPFNRASSAEGCHGKGTSVRAGYSEAAQIRAVQLVAGISASGVFCGMSLMVSGPTIDEEPL
ncbi:hypothetical protein ON010_g11907 [Phytophthora cinnamomi]|nr:hypothetical protein ON010_g11907 [Phytophthora cinnamomi]